MHDLQNRPSYLAAILSYLLPGLGQIYQGRFGKGLLFMVSLLGMFFLGQAMGDWRNVYMPPVDSGPPEGRHNPLGSLYNRWHFAGQFWIGIAAWPAIWQFYDMPMPGANENLFWRHYQRAPQSWQDEHEINEFLSDSDKTPDLGWVYTVIAGMLNVLVIYDAFAGPAFPSVAGRDDEPNPVTAPAGAEGVA
jgi:hypothetical protein